MIKNKAFSKKKKNYIYCPGNMTLEKAKAVTSNRKEYRLFSLIGPGLRQFFMGEKEGLIMI